MLCVAAYAVSGDANATPVRTVAGMARMPHHDGTPPRRPATPRNAVAVMAVLTPHQITKPPKTSAPESGVATMPWKNRTHFVPAMIGQRELFEHSSMADAASMPGVTNSR